MTTHVRVEVSDGVALVTLDGPERLNAFSPVTATELGAAYRRCDEDDGIRVVVLTGAGRAFCAGADLSPEAASFAPPATDFSASPVRPPAWEVRKLVIAAVNGPAIGIGLTTALQCDIRFVAEDAVLAIPQVRFGMIGDAQSHLTLRRAAGAAVAADLLLTGRKLTGSEACALGLASRALPTEDVLSATMALAREVAVHASPAAVALSKRLLWDDLRFEETERRETAAHQLLMAHPDAAEGAAAWREGRPPRWTFSVSDLDSSHPV